MGLRLPSIEEVLELAARFGIRLSEEDAVSFRGLMGGALASYARLDELPEPKLPVRYPRLPGHRPTPEENPFNAWYWKTEIKGASDGVLAGKRVAVKDCICVAGVPMMNGSRVLEGYVPDVDATVVTRVLDAGGIIAGKAACEDLCFSAGSHTCATGPVRNPYNPAYSAGGSSNGSAVLVATGEVEMALGGDQGGSIRTPSAWCGVYGLKPTWGLVPMTGAMPIAYSVDHCGPICSNVENVARLLTAIAGPDPLDPRTINARVGDYLGALQKDVRGLRIAVLKEGFGHPLSDAETDRKVRDAIAEFRHLGAEIEEVSVPMHYDGPHIWTGIILEGAAEMMIKGYGMGNNWPGYYTTSLQEAFARGWHSRPNDVSETVKLVLLLGEYMHSNYHNRYHAKAQNLRVKLRNAYDAVLANHDIIAMPTIPFPATEIPPPTAPREVYVDRALNMQQNTCPFDVTGHPAFTIPCGKVRGLPIGMMLVSRHFDEVILIRAAHAFEQIGDWQQR
ncbi:MAG: amidase [Acidobacteriia bacterium]|nr:amidase [Methyloceanibacter sp.]MCL6490629.1 amidase [Terriglobia bacterium]